MARRRTSCRHLPPGGLGSDHDRRHASGPSLDAGRLRLPFDYPQQTRILVVNDLERERPQATAAAMASLMVAAGGGGLGLFTAIRRLRAAHPELVRRLEAAGLLLYAQHVDG